MGSQHGVRVDHLVMVIDMNEAQVRTVEQVRQVLQGTQALEFGAAQSPIVGAFEDVGRMQRFVPPRAEHLACLSAEGRYTTPARCAVHVGELDWQSVPANVQAFAAPIGIPVTVVPGLGHMLGREYVGPLLDRWLPARAPAA